MALRLAAREVSFKKLFKKARDNPTEFSVWTNLLDLVEKEVYATGVKAVPLSVDLWVAYLDAAIDVYHTHEDYEEKMRSLYEEAIEVAGLEFRSDALWEHYISWESERDHLVNVLNIYTRLLATPTQSYFQNWDSLNKLIEENPPEELLSDSEFARLHAQVSLAVAKTMSDDMEPPIVGVTKPAVEITDSVRMAIRQLVVESRERVYQATYSQIMKRWYFEEKIRRPYFHVKPLEEVQLTNWAEYLSFEEAEASAVLAACRDEARSRGLTEDDDAIESAVKTSEQVVASRQRVHILYERCLVACAMYEHFWIRYARYLEVVEGDIVAARAVWRRACTVHLRYKPTIHWHWACFEERFPANLDEPQVYPVLSTLDILTELEKRLTDSPLVCCRRADAIRRAGKPLFDIIACLRGGINRLRFLAKEQDKVTQAVSGATASRTVAQAIATASQARAAAGVLSGRLARLLHRDDTLTSAGVPLWMLLLDTTYKEEDVIQEGVEDEEHQEQESSDLKDIEVKVKDEEHETDTVEKAKSDTEPEPEKTPANGQGDDSFLDENGADSPPMLVVPAHSKNPVEQDSKQSRKRNGGVSQERRYKKRSKRPKVEDGLEDDEEIKDDDLEEIDSQSDEGCPDGTEDDDASDDMEEEEEEEPEANALTVAEQERAAREAQVAAEEEEEERLRAMLDKRQPLVPIPRPAVDALTEAECLVLMSEEAAIRVLKEAIEYDPRNERLYAQLVDIAYQRRPVDVEGFTEISNMATIDSMLPASIKLAFCQRKLQFLEEFDTDIQRLTVAYNEYLRLCEAVNNAVATTTSLSSYPLPDLLNLPSASVRVATVAAANAASDDLPSLASASPVARQSLLKTDQAALEAAASVGTPAPDPSTSAGFYTAGGYEPLAAALGNTGSLPPPVPTNIPVLGDPSQANTAWVDSYTASYYYGTTAAVSGVPLVNYVTTSEAGATPTTSVAVPTSGTSVATPVSLH